MPLDQCSVMSRFHVWYGCLAARFKAEGGASSFHQMIKVTTPSNTLLRWRSVGQSH